VRLTENQLHLGGCGGSNGGVVLLSLSLSLSLSLYFSQQGLLDNSTEPKTFKQEKQISGRKNKNLFFCNISVMSTLKSERRE
jgi:hypothetical protein